MERKIYGQAINAALILWIVLMTLFIFLNSTMDYSVSHSVSESVTGIFVEKVEATEESNPELAARKAAHVIEFAFLGMGLGLSVLRIRRLFGRTPLGAACFYALAVAVADEHIQSFSDRTSSTADILLDFGGAAIGIALAAGVILAVSTIQKRSAPAVLLKGDRPL